MTFVITQILSPQHTAGMVKKSQASQNLINIFLDVK